MTGSVSNEVLEALNDVLRKYKKDDKDLFVEDHALVDSGIRFFLSRHLNPTEESGIMDALPYGHTYQVQTMKTMRGNTPVSKNTAFIMCSAAALANPNQILRPTFVRVGALLLFLWLFVGSTYLIRSSAFEAA